MILDYKDQLEFNPLQVNFLPNIKPSLVSFEFPQNKLVSDWFINFDVYGNKQIVRQACFPSHHFFFLIVKLNFSRIFFLICAFSKIMNFSTSTSFKPSSLLPRKNGPDRFSRFDVYRIQTKQTDGQTSKVNI